MIRFFYNFLIYGLAPLWMLWMWRRTSKRHEKPKWQERWGRYDIHPKGEKPRVWVHAVSVGEVIAARPVLAALRNINPRFEVVLTCTTSTGHSVARGLLGKSVDHLFYFPIDVPHACKRAIGRVQPDAVAIMETELWMNFLHFAKRSGAKTLIINGRISKRSFARARKFRFFYRALLEYVDRCLMQTQRDVERILHLGAISAEVYGNSKYDEAEFSPTHPLREVLGIPHGEPWIVVGSVRGEFEEDLVLSALQGLQCRILFAPRHIERASAILEKARTRGFAADLRTTGKSEAKFIVLDTYGELNAAYSGATVAIIGGGFDKLGGQNIIQPMAAGCPVVCGPHMDNFREPFEDGKAAGAILVAATPTELGACVQRILNESDLRNRMSQAARKLIETRRGASLKYAHAIAQAVIGVQ